MCVRHKKIRAFSRERNICINFVLVKMNSQSSSLLRFVFFFAVSTFSLKQILTKNLHAHSVLNSIDSATKSSENAPILVTHPYDARESNLQFLESLTLCNWGVFAQADVCFSSLPSFITITGETGAGKSVFLSALQYITGRTTARSMFVKRKEFKSDCSISINISKMRIGLHNNNEKSVSMKRIYNSETKKSVAEINCSKVPIKTLTSTSAKVVRFWSSDSISKLDSKEFISYVDANLHPSEVKQLDELALSYDEWLYAYNKLSELRQLKNRMDKNDEEFHLISHFISEVDNFYATVGNIFYDTTAMLEDYFLSPDTLNDDINTQQRRNNPPPLDTGSSNDRSTISAMSVLISLRIAMKNDQKKSAAAASINHSTVNSKENALPSIPSDGNRAWNALVLAEDFYKEIIQSITAALSSSSQPSRSSSPRSGDGDTSEFNSLQSVRTYIDNYAERLLTLQEDLKDLGCVRATVDDKVDQAYASLQDAAAGLTKALKAIKDFTKSLPNFKSHLTELTGIKSEWEKLARKHGIIVYELCCCATVPTIYFACSESLQPVDVNGQGSSRTSYSAGEVRGRKIYLQCPLWPIRCPPQRRRKRNRGASSSEGRRSCLSLGIGRPQI